MTRQTVKSSDRVVEFEPRRATASPKGWDTLAQPNGLGTTPPNGPAA
jgi:hypothetical protein